MRSTYCLNCRLQAAFFLLGAALIVSIVAGCSTAKMESVSSQPTATQPQARLTERGPLHPQEAPPPEFPYPHGGPNDVRDILVLDGEYFAATGKGIVRYREGANGPSLTAEYFTTAGLPSDNVLSLKVDRDGGVWALCEGGVGYLTKGATRWTKFTGRNGLTGGSVTDMKLSPDGGRVWVTSEKGIATTDVRRRRWNRYPGPYPIEVFVTPNAGTVWCQCVLPTGCICGRHVFTLALDLKTGRWLSMPSFGDDRTSIDPVPKYFCRTTNHLWLSGGYEPPVLYNSVTNEFRTWPKRPNWERGDGNVVEYWDWFGQMTPAPDDSGRMWFATDTGVWEYVPDDDRWVGHKFRDEMTASESLLAMTRDGGMVYWKSNTLNSEIVIAAYDVARHKWIQLWQTWNFSYMPAQEDLLLSPDEKYVWWIAPTGLLVGEPVLGESTLLTDTTEAGFGTCRKVRFDAARKRALVATARGIIVTDYAGKVRQTLKRPACPLVSEVKRLVIAPDGSEVWCFMREDRPCAAVLHPSENRWEEVPDPAAGAQLHDVVFSKDAETAWISISQDGPDGDRLFERTKGDQRWVPTRTRMPTLHERVEKFWLNRKGSELWLDCSGCGVLRVILSTGEISQYVKSEFRDLHLGKTFSLVSDSAQDLLFAANGRVAVCSAFGGTDQGVTLIDLQTGASQDFPTATAVRHMQFSADQKAVICQSSERDPVMVLDLERREWVTPGTGSYTIIAAQTQPTPKEKNLETSLQTAAKERGLEVGRCTKPIDGRYVVCELGSGIYVFDTKHRSLRKLKDIGSAKVTAMEVGPGEIVWTAVPGCVMSIEPRTGKVTRFE